MQPQQWQEAMAAAKLAVRAYAHDPSSNNATEVEVALQRIRRLKSVAEWRRPSPSAQERRGTPTGAR